MCHELRCRNRLLALTLLCLFCACPAPRAQAAPADLPVLTPGQELQPGWEEQVKLADDAAASTGKALVLPLTPENGKATGLAYWNPHLAGQITRAPAVTLLPYHRYRAWVRLRVRPNVGSGSAVTLYMSTDGTDYNPQITWRDTARYYGFQFDAPDQYQAMPVVFSTRETGVVVPEVRVINLAPLADGRSTGGGDLEEVALDTIRFEDLTPPLAVAQVRASQSSYRRADPKRAAVTVHNFTDQPQNADLRVTLHRDLDQSTVLSTRKITLPPGERREFSFPFQADAEFGYEVRATLLQNGKTLDAASDVFTVADNVYKLQMWVSEGPTNAQSLCWSGAVDLRRVPEYAESMRAACGNFYEFFAWPPDDGLDFAPRGDKWWAGQNGYPESKPNLQNILRELHRHGIKALFYAAWWSNGTGLETFRRHPDWFLYDADTGRGGGCDLASYKQAQQLRAQGQEGEGLMRGGGGGGAAPNWADPRVVDAGLDSMRESIKLFGWDGVRWDGEYQMTYFWDLMDLQGRLVKQVNRDLDATNTRILKQIIERFRRQEPGFVWGYNNEMNPRLWGDKPPSNLAYKLAQGGSLMWESPREADHPANPNHLFAEYSKHTCEMADYCRERGGYFMQFPAGMGWVGTVHDRLYKTLLPVVGGSTVYGNTAFLANTLGRYNRFIARYSALWWGDQVRSVRQPERFLSVAGAAPIWWQDYVDQRPAPGGRRDLIVHLVSEPVCQEIGPDAIGKMPPLQTDLQLRLSPRFGGPVEQAWFLTAEPQVTQQPLEAPKVGDLYEVTVPRLQTWSVVVLRLKGGN